MSEDLDHIIATFRVIERESAHSAEIFEGLSFITELLNNCDPKRLTKAHVSRKFKIARLTIDIYYNGDK